MPSGLTVEPVEAGVVDVTVVETGDRVVGDPPSITCLIVFVNMKGSPKHRPRKSSVSIDQTIAPPSPIMLAYFALNIVRKKKLINMI